MQPIVPVLKLGDSNGRVANLVEALLVLVRRGEIKSFDEPNRPTAAELRDVADKARAEQGAAVFGEATLRLVLYFQIQKGLGDNLQGVVEDQTARRMNEILGALGLFEPVLDHVVRGTIRYANGSVVPHVVVRVLDRDVRRAQLLRQAQANGHGQFEAFYSTRQSGEAEQSGADVQVQVFETEALDRLLGQSDVVFNAGRETVIDVTVDDPTQPAQSEFDSCLATLEPLLRGQADDGGDLAISELKAADIDFLALETGIDARHLAWLADAHRAGEALGFELATPACFGWFRTGVEPNADAIRQRTPSDLRAKLLEALAQRIVPASLGRHVEKILENLGHPEWSTVKQVLGQIELPADRAREVATLVDTMSAIDDVTLEGLVQASILALEDAGRLGLAASLYRAAGENVKAAQAGMARRFESLGKRPLARSDDLARLTGPEWIAFLREAEAAVPAGSTLEALAADLEEAAAGAYPTVGLFRRAASAPADLSARLDALQPRTDALEALWKTPLESPEMHSIVEGLPAEEKAAFEDVRRTARRYPALPLNDLTLGGLAEAISGLASDLSRVESANPGVDLLSIDLSAGSRDVAQLELGFLDDVRRATLLKQLRVLKVVLGAAGHPTRAMKLMSAGYYSATRIALTTYPELVAAGLDEAEAREVYERARTASLQAVHAWMAVRDAEADQQLLSGTSRSMRAATARQLAQWTQMFGSANYCDCDHCHSVLGPAAYFVDLMHYVERFILDPSRAVAPERQLANRRGDLWTDRLISCESTDEIVPTLDIVNSLLERWITARQPQWQTAFQIFRGLATEDAANPSFRLPVNFALDRLEILLAHFGLSRDRVVQALGGTGTSRLNARLKSWPAERSLIENVRPDDASAATWFEALYEAGNLNLPNGPGRLDQVIPATFELSWLVRSTRVDRDVMRAMLRTRWLNRDGSTGVADVAVKLVGPSGAVQNTMEVVENLTRRRLDRLHRLVRLWKKLPWTVAELDYVLTRITPANTAAAFTAPVLTAIVELLDLTDATGLALDEVMALWDEIPREGFRGRPSLFDRRFNAEAFVVRSGSWPQALPVDLPLPLTAPTTPAADSTGARLLAALKMSDASFMELVEALAAVPGLVTMTAGVPSSLRVSATTLPTLFRHAALSKVLKVKPGELMRLIRLTPGIASRPASAQIITSRADLGALLAFATWQRASGYSLDDIEWLADPAARPLSEPLAADAAARVVARIGSDHLVTFPATVFTSVGFTEAQSRQLTATLEGPVIERSVANAPAQPAAGGAPGEPVPQAEYRLKKGITDAALSAAVVTAASPLSFDVAETAVFDVARRRAPFDDTIFTALFLAESVSKDLVRLNLDDGLPASTRRPFVRTAPTATTYALNPVYFREEQAAPLVVPTDQAGSAINLGGAILIGFLKAKVRAAPAASAISASRAVPETLLTEIGLSEQQSRWVVALNPVVAADSNDPTRVHRAFLPNPSGQGIVLNDPAIATTSLLPDLRDPVSEVRLRVAALLRSFDPLVVVERIVAAELSLEPAVVSALRGFPGGLPVVDAREIFGDTVEMPTLRGFVDRLQWLRRLFPPARFDANAVSVVIARWADAFAGAGNAIDRDRLRAVAAYGQWLATIGEAADSPEQRESTRAALDALIAPGAAQLTDAQRNALIASVLFASDAEIRGLREVPHLWSGRWHEQLELFSRALSIGRELGVGGKTLARIGGFDATSDPIDNAWKAADDIYGAFRAKYPEEKTYRDKSEAFEDLVRSKRRDALVAYVSTYRAGLSLRTASEQYAHFLIDVEAGGCARTSRLVAAISSLQLFVQRVLMGLEPANFGQDFRSQEARSQWYWRKHYRVWEANRKVFLFPENFIEPDLRDDKTPLFRELEEELLQRRITNPEAEESLAKYLAGYAEVGGLQIVGAYHDVVRGRELGFADDAIYVDVLYLIGATSDDPAVHYIRRLSNVARSQADAVAHPIQFSPWEKLGADIPARWVAPIVRHRRLMLFWVEFSTAATSRRVNGEGNYFDGYEHPFKVRWIEQRANGTWSAPQPATFEGDYAREIVSVVSDRLSIQRAVSGSNPPPLDTGDALKALEKGQSFGVVRGPTRYFKATPRTTLPAPSYGAILHHGAPIDSYTLTGWNWERVFPVTWESPSESILRLVVMNDEATGRQSDTNPRLFARANYFSGATPKRTSGLVRVKTTGDKHALRFWWAASGVDSWRPYWDATDQFFKGAAPTVTSVELAKFSSIADGVLVNARTGPAAAAVVVHDAATGLVVPGAQAHRYLRLSTTTHAPLQRQLRALSVAGLLEPGFQRRVAEAPLTIEATTSLALPAARTKLDFTGAFDVYLWEIFFHTPFLIANHLNSQQRFEDAQNWYHYIFNPVASDGHWRFREFSHYTPEPLRDALTRRAALDRYRNDPFNPHAIARLRLGAYQKSIVMKYIDNLLDWADKLFSQFTMESVNEATMLYVLAADILGERPDKLPACVEDKDRSYNDIKPRLSEVSDFLIEEMEVLTVDLPHGQGAVIEWPPPRPAGTRALVAGAFNVERGLGFGGGDVLPDAAGSPGGFTPGGGYWSATGGRSLQSLYEDPIAPAGAGFTVVGTDSGRMLQTAPIDFVEGFTDIRTELFGNTFDPSLSGAIPGGVLPGTRDLQLDIKHTLHDRPPHQHHGGGRFTPNEPPLAELVPAKNIFCFPVNRDLLDYHGRVQDRLYKIRHCMDIAGVRRRLELFAPEIDPRLLVRMRAAGLTLEDVLNATSGHAPPYRFSILVDKARQYAQTVQSLGGQLLAALEKRDNEELVALRAVHEQRLLEMRTQIMRWEIEAANDALAATRRQKELAEYRQQHFEQLVAAGLVPWEQVQQVSLHTSLGLSTVAVIMDIASGIAGAVPDVYAPTLPAGTTVKTGGSGLSTVFAQLASALRGSAGIAQGLSQSAGLEASFQRRAEEWQHQIGLARREAAQLDKQIEAAEIRVAIAERTLEVHQESIAQSREIYSFHRQKFTSLGLFTWMSTQLHRYHRLAFDAAWNMARMAERSLHFERPELRDTVALGAPTWAADRAGLLSGESLLLDLQRLEASYLLTNTRQLEVEQSFSLAQYFPDKIVELRDTGECSFDVPELFFDLHYPGHYFRRIKAVRLSIPCVVGPHTSVGATLRMLGSWLRDTPTVDGTLAEVPLRHAPTLAASTALNDGGLFEFSFRDERLLPFEGMGAISRWNLRLPRQVRPFDYRTISDVILRISYTAREDDALRDDIDAKNGALSARLREAAPGVGFSVRHDFPDIWAKLKQAPATNGRLAADFAGDLELTDRSYPWWLRPRLYAQEDATLHALFAGAGARIRAKIGDAAAADLEEHKPPSTLSKDGSWWSRSFADAKPSAAPNPANPSRTLRITVDRNDMTDLVIVLRASE